MISTLEIKAHDRMQLCLEETGNQGLKLCIGKMGLAQEICSNAEISSLTVGHKWRNNIIKILTELPREGTFIVRCSAVLSTLSSCYISHPIQDFLKKPKHITKLQEFV